MTIALYWTHVTCVLLSISGFLLRGVWMLTDSPRLQCRLVRVLPHVVDSVLLVSALGLAFSIRQYPFVHDWLTVKVMALLGYIGFGILALRGKTKRMRATGFVLAIGVFVFMVSVALSKQPAGMFAA